MPEPHLTDISDCRKTDVENSKASVDNGTFCIHDSVFAESWLVLKIYRTVRLTDDQNTKHNEGQQNKGKRLLRRTCRQDGLDGA